jgi:hypothetical protein
MMFFQISQAQTAFQGREDPLNEIIFKNTVLCVA